MNRHLCYLVAAALLAGCSSDVDRAREAVTDSLVITTDLEFHDLETFPGEVVCGSFSAYTSYSEPRVEHQPFLYRRGNVDKAPSARDLKFYCSADHSNTLLEMSGIGPFTADNDALAQITRDMTLLTAALEAYYADNHVYPTAAQGLAALVSKPEGGRPLPRYREGGYLKSVPSDPFGNPYRYSEVQWGRTKGRFTLSTLGRSAQPGGGGDEADVSTEYLPYLQHIALLLGVD